MVKGETFYGDYNSEALAAEALAMGKSEKKRGFPISSKAALGKVLARMGREMIKETLTPVSGNRAVAEDIDSLLESLDRAGQEQFLLGLGGVCLGVTIETLEKAAIEGWDDKVFLVNYELAITGTQMPGLKLNVLAARVSGLRRTPQEETAIILQQAIADKTFLAFFDEDNRQSLPQIVGVLIYDFWPFRSAVRRILPIYSGAVKYL